MVTTYSSADNGTEVVTHEEQEPEGGGAERVNDRRKLMAKASGWLARASALASVS